MPPFPLIYVYVPLTIFSSLFVITIKGLDSDKQQWKSSDYKI